MDTTTVSSSVAEIEAIAQSILATIEEVDPAVGVPSEVAAGIVTLVSSLVTAALNAWSAASGTPITQASVLALLPADTPLDAPTS